MTTNAWSRRAATLASQFTIRSPGKSRARASARANVRLATVTAAPASSNAAATARAEPPAPNNRAGPAAGSHPVCTQVGNKAIPVGVAAGDLAVAEYQRVHCPRAARRVIDLVANLEGGDFVRNGNVRAGETGRQQATHGNGKVAWTDRQGDIGAIDAMPLEPKPVQPGRARVGDRPTSDPGELVRDPSEWTYGHDPKRCRQDQSLTRSPWSRGCHAACPGRH